MNRPSRASRVFALGAAAAFVSLSACSILSGGDDSNGAASVDGGGDSEMHDSGRRDSGSTRRDSGISTSSDGGNSYQHDDAGHVIGEDGGPLLCDPQPLGSFAGGSYSPPIGPFTGDCNSADITNFLSCATGSDPTQCAQFEAGGARVTCGSCLLTPDSASHWGPALGTDPSKAFLNPSGCLALTFGEGSSAVGCGGATQRAINCNTIACDATFNCAGSTNDEIQTCVNSAAAGECASYQSSAQTACDKDAGGAQAICSPADSAALTSFLNLFCGSQG